MEHCGDDFLASLAESMQDTEDWDDVQAMESEACGALSEILNKDLLQNYDSDVAERKSQVHIIKDSHISQKHQNTIHLDSSSEDEEAHEFFSREHMTPSSNISADGNGHDLSPSSIELPSFSVRISFFVISTAIIVYGAGALGRKNLGKKQYNPPCLIKLCIEFPLSTCA